MRYTPASGIVGRAIEQMGKRYDETLTDTNMHALS